MGTAYRELFKLYDLIQNGDTRSVRSFLTENTIDINTIIPCKGIGLLHLAVGIDPLEKSKECTETLLKHGGDANLRNDDGVTPVHIAAIWGRVDNLKLLIGCGGDPALEDFDGLSAFAYAAREQQWEVYDYLNNVVDQLENTDNSKCAFTLDLDKILVTTDQVVAEYQPMTDEHGKNNTALQKSDIVQNWCEYNSLIVNKLYPTIIGETYLEDESVPWNDKNITLDLTKQTETSFKTCQSNQSIEISGIQPLVTTKDLKRKSIYENFSLPGSPKNITHVNYKSKSNLRCKNHSSDLKDNQCIETSESLDKALAVVQNRTNEWLAVDSNCNTRRSSASSGVSSNYTGGSIVIANVHEEYKYEDKEEQVVLIEKRLLVSPVILPVEESCDGSPDQTIISIASSLPTSVRYDDKTLRAELTRLGYNPGPIQDNTRTLYLKKLRALKKNPTVVTRKGRTYSVELEKSLRSNEWMRNLSPYEELERKARADFTNPSKEWREGKSKTSFTYLLLDPRLTDNLPAKEGSQSKQDMWVTFVNSIFYVGKGKRSRPYAHLYQALTLWKSGFTQSNDKKIQHILDIWQNKLGVVCLHIFQNVIPAEAYTYEAAMIDVIGVSTLTNLKCGTYYGLPASWPHKDRRMLGLYLLYKAMQIFINEGERQLRPDDI